MEDLSEVMPKGVKLKQETSERVNLTEVGPAGPKIELKEKDADKKQLVYLKG